MPKRKQTCIVKKIYKYLYHNLKCYIFVLIGICGEFTKMVKWNTELWFCQIVSLIGIWNVRPISTALERCWALLSDHLRDPLNQSCGGAVGGTIGAVASQPITLAVEGRAVSAHVIGWTNGSTFLHALRALRRPAWLVEVMARRPRAFNNTHWPLIVM